MSSGKELLHRVRKSTFFHVDGIALFLSYVRYLQSSIPSSSFFMLSTHFSDYLEHECIKSLDVGFEFKQMHVILDDSNGNAVTPLFQVIDGVCQDSFGIRCAAVFGMPEEITSRAQQVGSSGYLPADLRLYPREQGSPSCQEFGDAQKGGDD